MLLELDIFLMEIYAPMVQWKMGSLQDLFPGNWGVVFYSRDYGRKGIQIQIWLILTTQQPFLRSQLHKFLCLFHYSM